LLSAVVLSCCVSLIRRPRGSTRFPYTTLFRSVALAGGALFAGVSGLGEAIRGDAEALAELAPPARELALTLRSLGSEWGALQDAVQERLLQGWAEALDHAPTSPLPVPGRRLESAADATHGRGLSRAVAADPRARAG